jgi:aromatic ring-opening dioxygenase LigB subunit
LVFAAHVPHTPLLLSTVGRENTAVLKKTIAATKILSEELYAARPDVVLIMSGHGNPSPEVFAVNLNNHYKTNLDEFGDLSTKIGYPPEICCVDRLQRFIRRSNLPFTLFSDPSLGHATAIPLILLTEKLKKFSVLPIFSAPKLEPKKHFEFGQALREVILSSDKRVAVISAGDLSHALSTEAPAGLRPAGVKFDHLIREAAKSVTASGLLQLEKEFLQQAAECAYRPILIILGLLEGARVKSEELSYEAPFGVGYLTVQFHLF